MYKYTITPLYDASGTNAGLAFVVGLVALALCVFVFFSLRCKTWSWGGFLALVTVCSGLTYATYHGSVTYVPPRNEAVTARFEGYVAEKHITSTSKVCSVSSTVYAAFIT